MGRARSGSFCLARARAVRTLAASALSLVVPSVVVLGCIGDAPTLPSGSGPAVDASNPPDVSTGGCPTGQEPCGTTCTNTKLDPANCGACGKTCSDGQVCSGGSCALTCQTGFTLCTPVSAYRPDASAPDAEAGVADSGAADASTEGGADASTVDAGPPAARCVDTRDDVNHCGGCNVRCGSGDTCVSGACTAQPKCPKLVATLRDFKVGHPDFEDFLGDDRGIVGINLGSDFKPMYSPANTSPTTTGKANFDQWFRNVPGVNQSFPYEVKLLKGENGVFTFSDFDFFPLDQRGWGNEGNGHNYHFTFELHAEFAYRGGEVFTFSGDDDVFVFINRKLAINLGGVHSPQQQTVNLDQKAIELGLTKGKTYELALFQAERRTPGSVFTLSTTIEFTNCNPITH